MDHSLALKSSLIHEMPTSLVSPTIPSSHLTPTPLAAHLAPSLLSTDRGERLEHGAGEQGARAVYAPQRTF